MAVMLLDPSLSGPHSSHSFVNATFTDKVKRGIFAPIKRYLTGYHDAEDRLQDAIASTWWLYRRAYIERGQVLDDALLVYHCRLRAIDAHHRFVPGHRARRANDVYDPRARKRGVRISSGFDAEHGSDPTQAMNASLDLERLHGDLDPIDQAVMAGNLRGETTTEIARRLGMSISGVHRRERLLGRRLLREHARG